MPKQLRRAEVGESYHLAGDNEVYEVAPKGEGNKGYWVCCSCGTAFQNQLQKDFHVGGPSPRRRCMVVEKGPPVAHVLAWISEVTGMVEVP